MKLIYDHTRTPKYDSLNLEWGKDDDRNPGLLVPHSFQPFLERSGVKDTEGLSKLIREDNEGLRDLTIKWDEAKEEALSLISSPPPEAKSAGNSAPSQRARPSDKDAKKGEAKYVPILPGKLHYILKCIGVGFIISALVPQLAMGVLFILGVLVCAGSGFIEICKIHRE